MQALLLSTLAVAVAEIGDKTQLLALLLAARFRKPLPIVAGILVATLLNHALAAWAITAGVSAALIGAEMIARTRRHHGGLADAMLMNAVEQALPAGVAGVAIALVLVQFAQDTLWVLPGLWQVLVGLGIFASVRSLPRSVAWAGTWYVAAGLVVLALSSQTQTLSPWAMGAPFVVGQLLLGGILHFAFGAGDDEFAG